MNHRSDAPHLWRSGNRRTRQGRAVRLRSGRRLPRERSSLRGRAGRRSAASRNQTNWFAAIAGAVTWPRASSSGGIADAATVSVNAMGRRHRRGRRRSKSSSATTRDEGPGWKGLGPFSLRASSQHFSSGITKAAIARDSGSCFSRGSGFAKPHSAYNRNPLSLTSADCLSSKLIPL